MHKLLFVLLAGLMIVGCSGRAEVLPNTDKSLRRKPPEFAADAAKRVYPADAEIAPDAVSRAQVGYTLDVLEVANLSDQDWENVEVWVNQKYVVSIAKIERAIDGDSTGRVKVFNFRMLYDNAGRHFPTDNSKTLVEKVEVFHAGKLYNVPFNQAD